MQEPERDAPDPRAKRRAYWVFQGFNAAYVGMMMLIWWLSMWLGAPWLWKAVSGAVIAAGLALTLTVLWLGIRGAVGDLRAQAGATGRHAAVEASEPTAAHARKAVGKARREALSTIAGSAVFAMVLAGFGMSLIVGALRAEKGAQDMFGSLLVGGGVLSVLALVVRRLRVVRNQRAGGPA